MTNRMDERDERINDRRPFHFSERLNNHLSLISCHVQAPFSSIVNNKKSHGFRFAVAYSFRQTLPNNFTAKQTAT